ncbi:cytochrome c oxidase subunit 4 [Salinibacterium sp. NSLL150]|uniref:cytochrome c oxidase subunit 4 n=1 Tax=unclassified Salinibacterium TaxID=2632331 RepID=UPI0018CCF1CC|nr:MULTISPECIES: cytochrome c oxidase subunit 4 [unclassified Salinibacterium]MBH0099234.1 cytochrome c oxidase subunit 4 [Salinibacterium sp. NSLL35]MBH0101988.1 cytochrome c oxidase subunit 4 [Salinibacterium sp. NSLL150]MBH0104748.1 cytochrome c oxidase subunit 4 [Salinibacterium sp. NSLL16]MBH0107508.1 cytochrome c oxidase subunit 4 [Salinibacterium sp. NSLL17]MBH0108712.1 cytochrome c oxidase subunit 4 [Salinibacterium sp. NG22]
MNANVKLYWILTVFFLLLSGLYTVWSLLDASHQRIEWVGTIALLLSGLLFLLIGFYLSKVHAAQGGELAEDRLDANIEDGDAEQGHYSPWSWWPIVLAGAASLVFLGVAIGAWIAFIGGGILVVSLVGWTYEYYRGYFAR